MQAVKQTVLAFKAILQSSGEDKASTHYKVDGSSGETQFIFIDIIVFVYRNILQNAYVIVTLVRLVL